MTTVRIENSDGRKTNYGTGFLVDTLETNKSFMQRMFIVSNKHVITNFPDATIYFIPRSYGGNDLFGQVTCAKVEDWRNHWVLHPSPDVDVAILPFTEITQATAPNPAVSNGVFNIGNVGWPTTSMLTTNNLRQFQAIESVVFLGYPSGVYDTTHTLPISRQGTTASPLTVDFLGRRCFAVDAAVFPGSSGSPVFLYNPIGYLDSHGGMMQSRVLLVGIIAENYYVNAENVFTLRQVPSDWTGTFTNAQPFNLGIAFRSDTILELLDQYRHTHP